jgi:TonB family protein
MMDVLDSARRGDQEKLARSVKDMEIPDFSSWSATVFVQDRAKSWSDAYGSGLERNEVALEKLFAQLAQLRGQISSRKVNNSNELAEGPESVMRASLKQPLDIYLAEWRDPVTPGDAKGEPIGYFFFVSGKFRWNSAIMLPKPRSASGAIAPPRLVKRVDPIYPLEAQAAGIGGAVTLRVRVEIDGSAVVEAILSGDERLAQSAKDAVRQWRFEPASLNDKPIEVETTVEVNFLLMRAPIP